MLNDKVQALIKTQKAQSVLVEEKLQKTRDSTGTLLNAISTKKNSRIVITTANSRKESHAGLAGNGTATVDVR